MAIGNAFERGGWVYIYDENGSQTATVNAGNGPEDGLKGYTSSRVNVRIGDWIYTYDERGSQTGVTRAR